MGKREREDMSGEVAAAEPNDAQGGKQQVCLPATIAAAVGAVAVARCCPVEQDSPAKAEQIITAHMFHPWHLQEVEGVMRPRKAFYRARAHSNPFNDGIHLDIPPNPDAYDW
jgi:hypothetical protein